MSDFANRLRDLGVPVFGGPLRRADRPGFWCRTPDKWQQTAPHDASAVPEQYQYLAGVGGHVFDVIDVDPRNGGEESFARLVADGLMPRHYAVVTTPRGGRHYYVKSFGAPKDGLEAEGYPGVDVQSGGGLFVLPPTERPGYGVYALVEDRLDEFDNEDGSGKALADLIRETRASKPGSGADVSPIGTPIPHGSHQAELFRYACSLRARGMVEAEIAPLVGLRALDCSPPWEGPQTPWEAVRHVLDYAQGDYTDAFGFVDAERLAGLIRGDVAPTSTATVRRITVQRASEIAMEATDWLWTEGDQLMVPLVGLSLVGGRESTGKTTWAYRLAAQVTRGTLDGDLAGRPRGVLVSAHEDSWEATIKPRLAAAGADMDRVLRIDCQTTNGRVPITLPTDVSEVADLAREHDVAMLLLDPLMGAVSGKLDTHKDSEVRQALQPLSDMAHDARLAVLGLIHVNKSESVKSGPEDLVNKIMGSRAFVAVARCVLVCSRYRNESEDDPFEDVEQFLIGREKCNLAPDPRFSIRYAIEQVDVGHDAGRDKPITSSRIRVLGRETGKVSSLVAVEGKHDSAFDRCCVDLRDGMAKLAHDGKVSATTIDKWLMGEREHSESTIKRAKKALGVRSVRAGQQWFWVLE